MGWWAVYTREMQLLQKKMGKLGYIFSTLMFPLIYLFAFGWGIGSMVNIQGGYLPFLGKGMLGITVMLNSFQQTALSVSVGRFYFHTFQTLMLSPISSVQVIGGIVMSGVTRGVIAGGAVYGIAMLMFDAPMIDAVGLIGVVLAAFCFGALGVVVGMWVRHPDALSTVINFIITPMTFFCGSFFPLNNLPQWLQTAVEFMPLTILNRMLRTEAFATEIFYWVGILVITSMALLMVSVYQVKNYSE